MGQGEVKRETPAGWLSVPVASLKERCKRHRRPDRDAYAEDSAECRNLRAAEVCAFAGVDADFFSFVDEGGHLDDEAGLGFGGLGDAGGGGRLEARFGFDDGQLDGGGQVDAHGLAVMVADLDLQVGGEVLDGVAQRGALENGLLE